MKTLIVAIALFSGLVSSALPCLADTLELHSLSGHKLGGEAIYPYNFRINDSHGLTSLMCLDMLRSVSVDEMWNVSIVPVSLDASQSSINYRAQAWIYSQLGSYSTAEVQYAVWDISDPLHVDPHVGFADSPNAQMLAQMGLLMAQDALLMNSGFFSQFSLYLPTSDQTGWTGGIPQDFIGAAQTPEPSSLILMGSGLIGVGGALRRRLRA